MTNDKTPRAWTANRIAWITGIACVACCALPLLGIAIGSASIAGLALYSEKAAAAIAVIGAGFFVFKRLSKRSDPACDIDGRCRPAKAEPEAQREN